MDIVRDSMADMVAEIAVAPEPSEDRIQFIEKRICEKIDDYDLYDFSAEEDCAVKVFFDLSQEFERVDDFYRICVMVPKTFYGLESSIYLIDRSSLLTKVCSSELLTKLSETEPQTVPAKFFEQSVIIGDSFFIPIRGKSDYVGQLPIVPKGNIMGLFEIYPAAELTDHQKFFFEKYTNRIGFQLHNKMVEQRNLEHLRFIKSLVSDIGHNVVVPNMYYKLFFRRLGGKIGHIGELDSMLKEMLLTADKTGKTPDMEQLRNLERQLAYVNEGLEDQFAQIQSHYEHTSLFLETLLRRSHFEEGRYVLDKRRCNFRKQVIEPQLKRYLPRLKGRGIEVDDQLGGVPDEEIEAVADVGLISQVYANFFSNAVKYTRTVYDDQGAPHKFIACGRETIRDYFGEGKDGLKLNVFSTGKHVSEEDRPRLFEEGFRGANVPGEVGTGHGLHFVSEIIKLHGGVVGYEPTALGNNFYFILPK